MIKFDFDKDCCGCTACANSCNHGAITMKANKEGFLMPMVDQTKCVDCGLCDKACPHLNTPFDTSHFSLDSFAEKKAYLYFSLDSRRKQSASGGLVYDIYNKVLKEGGVVCGCVWNEKMEAVHVIADNMEDMHKMQSSKYVQSNLLNSFKQIRKYLRDGRKVAFCGTPCQTAGLKSFLGKTDRSNLISICLICHGVPSPGVWNRWKKVMEKKYGGHLIDVNMRDKSYKGYSTSHVKYTFEYSSNGRENTCGSHTSPKLRNVGMPTYLSDPYVFLFTDNLYLRHSCNHCQYKAGQNGADIIVGDYYQSTPEAGNDGCSCVFAMNEKGDKIVNELEGKIIPTDYKTIGSVNVMLWDSVAENSKRRAFFSRYSSEGEVSESLFTDFLPIRFKVKKLLNQLRLFNVVRRILKQIYIFDLKVKNKYANN